MTISSTESNAPAPRDLPTWLTVIIVLLCLAGGGGVVWWYFSSPPKVVAIPLADGPRMPVRQGAGNNNAPRIVEDWNSDVRPGNNNSFQVRSGDVQMWVRPRDGQAEPSLTFYYRNQLLPREQLNLLRAPMMANRDDQVQRLKLTPEQIASLQKIRNVRGMRLSKEEEQSVRTAWVAFQGAPGDKKQDAKSALLTLLDGLGKKNLDSTKTALTENVAAIRAVLTPDQQKMIESGQL